MKLSLNPVARNKDLVIQELPDEVLVFDIQSNKAHCLNQTASSVWKYCDGTNSVEEIKRLLESQTGSAVSEDLVWFAIDQLSEKDLLEAKVENKFEGLNRRQVLKKVGLAAVVALPIVASITAPTAAFAVACSGTVTSCVGCNDGTPCTVGGTPGMCLGGACSTPFAGTISKPSAPLGSGTKRTF